MANVFAISIFTVFLGAKGMKNTSASLDPGFYYFTVYVLLSSILIFLIITPKFPPAFNS